MPSSRPSHRCHLTIALLLAAAPRLVAAQTATSGAAAATPRWFEIARTPEIVAYLDTARLERTPGQGGQVWFRFEYTTPMQVGSDTTTRYRATEGHFAVNCRDAQARALSVYMETTEGVRAGSPMPDSPWQALEDQPLGSGVFYPACRALGMPLRVRGS